MPSLFGPKVTFWLQQFHMKDVPSGHTEMNLQQWDRLSVCCQQRQQKKALYVGELAFLGPGVHTIAL